MARMRLRSRDRYCWARPKRGRSLEPEEPFLLISFLLIFPIIGIALLSWNVLLKIRARRYSGTYFEMDSVPFFVGQDFTGRIHVPLRGRLSGPVQLTLNCIRRTKSATRGLTEGSKTTWDELVWCDKKLGHSSGTDAESEWSTIPVEFSIPPDVPTTDSGNPDGRILWVLRAFARLRGVASSRG
jgi:hypothetical protein